MATLGEELATLAREMIADLGVNGTWTKQIVTGVPATGEVTLGAPTNYAVLLAPPDLLQAEFVDGEVYKAGDLLSYMAPEGLAFTPEVGDRVAVGGTTYVVVGLSQVLSGRTTAGVNVNALWRVVMRK